MTGTLSVGGTYTQQMWCLESVYKPLEYSFNSRLTANKSPAALVVLSSSVVYVDTPEMLAVINDTPRDDSARCT